MQTPEGQRGLGQLLHLENLSATVPDIDIPNERTDRLATGLQRPTARGDGQAWRTRATFHLGEEQLALRQERILQAGGP